MELSVFNCISQTKVLVFRPKTANCFQCSMSNVQYPMSDVRWKTKSATKKLSFICGNCNSIKFSKHANCECEQSTNIDWDADRTGLKLVCIISLALICSKCNCKCVAIHLACHWLNEPMWPAGCLKSNFKSRMALGAECAAPPNQSPPLPQQ